MHACIHTYMHTYIHTSMHAYIHTYIHACMHTYMHTYIHTCIHACIHTYIHTDTHRQTDRQTYRQTYIQTDIHTIPCHAMPCHAIPYHTIPYIHTHRYIYIYIWYMQYAAVCICPSSSFGMMIPGHQCFEFFFDKVNGLQPPRVIDLAFLYPWCRWWLFQSFMMPREQNLQTSREWWDHEIPPHHLFRLVPCRGSKPSTPRAVLPWPPPGGTPGAARRNSSMISGLQLPRMGGGAGRRASAAGMSSVAMARRGARSGQKTCGVTSIHRDHGHVIVMLLSWYFMVCHGGMVWNGMYIFNYNWSVMVCGYGYLRVQDSGIVSP